MAEVAAAREVALTTSGARRRRSSSRAFEEELDARLAEQQASHDAELDRFTAKLEKKMTKVAREFAAKDAEHRCSPAKRGEDGSPCRPCRRT